MIRITVIDSPQKMFTGNDLAVKDEAIDEVLGC